MDLEALKNKLDGLQQKTNVGQKRDYSLTFWKPSLGKQQIRIVPSVFTPKNPFTELRFYYGITFGGGLDMTFDIGTFGFGISYNIGLKKTKEVHFKTSSLANYPWDFKIPGFSHDALVIDFSYLVDVR